MAPTNNSKWAVLRELARARLPEDEKMLRHAQGGGARRPAASQTWQPSWRRGGGHPGRRGNEARRGAPGHQLPPATMVGSRQAEEEA
jgi:hypothetical protein